MYDKALSVAKDAQYEQPRKYHLEKLDLSTRAVLDVGVIAQVAMEKTRFEGSEDYSDLFDSVGMVLRYSAHQMLQKVYSVRGDDMIPDWDEAKMEELHDALLCIEQFQLIGRLKK